MLYIIWIILTFSYILYLWRFEEILISQFRKHGGVIHRGINVLVACLIIPLIATSISSSSLKKENEKLRGDIRDLNESVKRISAAIVTKFESRAIEDLNEYREIVNKRYEWIINAIPNSEWAKDLKSNLEEKRKQIDKLIDDEKQLSKRVPPYISGFFKFALKKFDDLTYSYQEDDIKLEVSADNTFQILDSKNYVLRQVIFPNKNFIDVRVASGSIENDQIKDYPRLSFVGQLQSYRFRFIVEARTGGGKIFLKTRDIYRELAYPIDRDPLDDETLRRTLSENLRQLFECVFLSPPSEIAQKIYG